jgi:hypothetical protein
LFRLPGDYRLLVDRYGVGAFDDFMWLLHRTTSTPHLRLDKQIKDSRGGLEYVNETFARPSELIALAITDNGDICYWLSRGRPGEPDSWPIAVNESRGSEWEQSDFSTIAWLEAVLSGRLKLRIFPEDFPSEKPTFKAWREH